MPVILREELARERDAGVPFDMAWAWATLHALGAAPTPFEQREWREALFQTRPDWEAAYEDQPPTAAAAAAGAAVTA